MNDRELLERAAKAAGCKYSDFDFAGESGLQLLMPNQKKNWNPLTDDGDALRLAVKMNLRGLRICEKSAWVEPYASSLVFYEKDPYAATRRAIVRAVAEIGKSIT